LGVNVAKLGTSVAELGKFIWFYVSFC
jgi:hypothetical protein